MAGAAALIHPGEILLTEFMELLGLAKRVLSFRFVPEESAN